MTTTRTPLTVGERFDILSRDGFTCQACGARPGNDRLQVDHILPWSLGGSHHPANLTTLCDRCNNGKGARVFVPPRRLAAPADADGFAVWKRFGSWTVEVCADGVIANWARGRGYVWFGIERCLEADWVHHFGMKSAHVGCDADCDEEVRRRATGGVVTAGELMAELSRSLPIPRPDHKMSNLSETLDFMRLIYRRPGAER